MRPKVDVIVTVTPVMAGITIDIDLFDVDDPSDDDGPIDTDPTTDENNADNLGADLDTITTNNTTDANGKVRGTVDIGSPQPGNNFRVAAGARAAELDPALPGRIKSTLLR